MRLLKLLLMIIITIVVIVPSTAYAQIADSPWPMIHGNLRHTGLSPYNTSHVDGTVKWTFETGAGIESSPTIAKDGTIYIGSHNNKLYAINPDGSLKWKFEAGKPVYIKGWDVWKGIPSAPAIAKDGTIYFISPPIYLYALSPDGKEKWRYPIYTSAHFAASPAVGDDSTIYVGSESYPHEQGKEAVNHEFGARIYAINPNGTLKWRYDTDGSCLANPLAVAPDGTVYASGSDYIPEEQITGNALIAFNPNGSVKWKLRTDRIEGPPVIAEDETIYVGTKNGQLIAVNPAGRQKWFFQTASGISVMSALDKDGNIYFGSWDGNFYALNSKGKELWRFDIKKSLDPKLFKDYPFKEAITSSPAISAEGTIYFGDVISTFYALDLKGKEKWRYANKKGEGFSGSSAIGADGTVYIGSLNKKVYAFGSSSEVKEIKVPSMVQNEEKSELKKIKPLVILLTALVFFLVASVAIIFIRRKKQKRKMLKSN